jgi:hypothetical protein
LSRCNARSALGLSAGLLALASGHAASPAHASDECGPQTGTTVTCTSTGNPNASGITYAATQNLTLKIAPDVIVDTTSTHARGLTIGGTRNTSNVEIDAAGSSIVTSGATAATVATGTGNLSLNFGSIKTSGDNAAGINAASASGNVSASAQSIATTGAGATAILLASTSGTAAVTDYGTISTTGATAYGISARGVGVTIDGKGGIVTTGANATGVLVTATTGDTRLSLGTINTSGANAAGVNATSTTGNLSVSAQSVTTAGAGATAILTSSTSGAISVTDSGPISTSGTSAYGIFARGPAGVTVGGRGSITTTGGSATGVLVASTAGDIVLDLGEIRTSGDNAPGINAASASGNISVSAQSVTTSGANSSAMLLQATAGTVTVTNNGAISATGSAANGINARGTAGVTIAGQGSVVTTGAGANAIDVISSAGAVDVTQGSVSASGAGSIGIRVSATKDARVTAGNVTTTGSGSGAIAISALSSAGAATVSLSGTVRSASSIGVAINGKTSATLNLAAGASVDGATGAVSLVSGTAAVINNAGSIGPSGAAKLTAVTITATGGPVTINNSGTINGNLLLAAGNDVVTNTGVFNALGNSDFKTGNDLFDNRGTFNVAPSTIAATTVNLTALETFRNAGTVDFRNGHIGDQLVVQGNYVGVNGRMIVDIDPANPGSDLIQVSGSASGTTIVSLNPINDKALALNYGTPFMKVGAASDAGAFTLDPAQQNFSGLIGLGIKYDAGNLNYALVAMPGDAAYRTLAISAGVRNLWTQSADAWSARMQQVRDLQGISSNQSRGLWGQFIGQRQTRDFSQTSTVFGVTRPLAIGYAQNEIGGQIGVDFRSRADGTPIFGLTGGYVHSALSYDSVADRVTFQDVNAGAYFGYQSGALFFNLLGKYDFYWARNSSVSGGYSSRLNGSSYGVQAEVGGRLGGKAQFFEPHVSVAANHGRITDFAAAAGRFRFDDPDGLTLKAGGRIGSSFDLRGAKGAFFVRADYVYDVMGKDRVVFLSGGTNAALEMGAASPYGEGAVGVTVAGKSGMGVSIEGRYAKGGDSDGFGGRVTLRSAF